MSVIINQFNIAVPEHLCETFREKQPDIVGYVNPQGNQNGLSTHKLQILNGYAEQVVKILQCKSTFV